MLLNKNKNKKYCVYIHTNKNNGKKYVGQTCMKPENRWQNGMRYSHSPHFFSAIKKYGWDNFEHEIIKDNLTKEEADKLEIYLIDKLKTRNRDYGYNISEGGGSGYSGIKMSEEQKRKISESESGKLVSLETRTKISSSIKLGKHPRATKINQYTKDGKFVRTWDCISNAANFVGIDKSGIGKCCRGEQKSAGGYIWRYYRGQKYYRNKQQAI